MKNLFVFALILLSFSCSKDDNKAPAPTKKDLFAKTWRQTDILAALGGGVQSSVFTTVLTACQQDNLWQFKTDGTYTLLEGATRCPTSTSDVITTGTWTFSENDTKVTFVDAVNGTQTFTILELTATTMRLNGQINYQGTPVNVTAVFTAN